MSIWYNPKKEDIEIDGDELNILLGDDYGGNIYAAVKIKDIQEILEQLKEKDENNYCRR